MQHGSPDPGTDQLPDLNAEDATSASFSSCAIAPDVWALVALPPPVNGMTVLTERVVQRLQQNQPITVINWSSGKLHKRFSTRFVRSYRAVSSALRLLLHGRVHNARLFMTANSQGGLYITGLLVRICRALGYQIWLHHHSYLYID